MYKEVKERRGEGGEGGEGEGEGGEGGEGSIPAVLTACTLQLSFHSHKEVKRLSNSCFFYQNQISKRRQREVLKLKGEGTKIKGQSVPTKKELKYKGALEHHQNFFARKRKKT